MPTPIIVKLLKTNDKVGVVGGNTLKAVKEKGHFIYRQKEMKWQNFLWEAIESKRKWHDIFHAIKENCQCPENRRGTFYEARKNLIPKPDKHGTIRKKEDYRPMSFMDIETKILNKIWYIIITSLKRMKAWFYQLTQRKKS